MKEAICEKMDDLYCRILLPIQTIFSEKTEFQQMDIVKTKEGKALILDGSLQLHTKDEFIYHEMLVHFPMIYHSKPQSVLVLGGGDGFLLREILKYKSVKEVTLVDIDEKVVSACKKYFAQENEQSFEDPRLELVIDDALDYVDKTPKKFDIIIMDLIEPYGEGAKLYSDEGIRRFLRPLKSDGIFATHCEDAEGKNNIGLKLFALLSNMFPYSQIGTSYIRSFDGLWTYAVLSNSELKPVNTEVMQVKRRYFDPDNLVSHTWLPLYLEEILENFKKNGFERLVEEHVEMKKVLRSQSLEDILKD